MSKAVCTWHASNVVRLMRLVQSAFVCRRLRMKGCVHCAWPVREAERLIETRKSALMLVCCSARLCFT